MFFHDDVGNEAITIDECGNEHNSLSILLFYHQECKKEKADITFFSAFIVNSLLMNPSKQ